MAEVLSLSECYQFVVMIYPCSYIPNCDELIFPFSVLVSGYSRSNILIRHPPVIMWILGKSEWSSTQYYCEQQLYGY